MGPKKSTTLESYKRIYRMFLAGLPKWKIAEDLHISVDTVNKAVKCWEGR